MPYPNIHSAQVLSPDTYDKIVGQKELAPGVNALFCKVKDQEGTQVASYHFDKDKFTPEEAKKWLKDNDVKDYKFEEAKPEEKKSADIAGYERRIVVAEMAEVRLMPCGTDQQKRTICGYGARFYDGSPGTQCVLQAGKDGRARVVERIMPQAFDNDTLQDMGTDVIATFNHNPDMMLGRRANGTLRVACDHAGLRYEIDPPDTQCARDVVQLIERGDVRGSSFGFHCRAESWGKDGDCAVRSLKDVKLEDVGPVSNPAYAAASAGLRMADENGAAEAIRSMEAWREHDRRTAAAIAGTQARAKLAEITLRVCQ